LEPDDIAPELKSYAAILGAFMELSTERQVGMSVGPIPLSTVRAYLAEFSLPEWWGAVIARVDQYVLSEATAESEVA